MSSEFSDALMDEAEAAIKSEQSYQVSKDERTLDVMGAFRPPSTKCSDYNVYVHRLGTCRKESVGHLRQ